MALLMLLLVGACAVPSDSEGDSPITTKNSDEFKKLLAEAEDVTATQAFLKANMTGTVEFNGYVESVFHSEYFTSEVIVRAGTSPTELSGPRFVVGEISNTDEGKAINRMRQGDRLHVTGDLGKYQDDPASGLGAAPLLSLLECTVTNRSESK